MTAVQSPCFVLSVRHACEFGLTCPQTQEELAFTLGILLSALVPSPAGLLLQCVPSDLGRSQIKRAGDPVGTWNGVRTGPLRAAVTCDLPLRPASCSAVARVMWHCMSAGGPGRELRVEGRWTPGMLGREWRQGPGFAGPRVQGQATGLPTGVSTLCPECSPWALQ